VTTNYVDSQQMLIPSVPPIKLWHLDVRPVYEGLDCLYRASFLALAATSYSLFFTICNTGVTTEKESFITFMQLQLTNPA
jgi:hypothetical protein